MSNNKKKALQRSLKLAMIPMIMAGGPAFASGSRSNSRRSLRGSAVKSISVQSPSLSFRELKPQTHKYVDPFASFGGASGTSITSYADPEVDVLAFLSDNGLLEPSRERVSSMSSEIGGSEGRKKFSKRYCYSGTMARHTTRITYYQPFGAATRPTKTYVSSHKGPLYPVCMSRSPTLPRSTDLFAQLSCRNSASTTTFSGAQIIRIIKRQYHRCDIFQKRINNLAKHTKLPGDSGKSSSSTGATDKDVSGVCSVPGAQSRDPVDIASGNFFDSINLLGFGKDSPFQMRLDYNSGNFGNLGLGWHHAYLIKLLDLTHRVSVFWPDGRESIYKLGTTGYTTMAGGASGILAKNLDGTFTLVDRKQKSYHFDATGKLLSITDKHGFVQNLTYDAVTGNLTTVTDVLSGKTLTFTYDTRNRITSVTGAGIGSATLTYNTPGDLVSITDALGNTTTFTYDASHRLLTKTNALGQVVVSNTYDTTGKVISQDDGDPATPLETFTYGTDPVTNNPFTDYSGRAGQVTKYNFNASNDLLSRVDPLGGTVAHAYDPATGQRTSHTDELGNGTTFTYDAQGYVLTRTNAQGQTASYTYDANHNIIRITDEAGNTTTRTYDANHNVLTETDAKGAVTIYTYNAQGLLATKTAPRGGITTYAYDAIGQLITVTDPAGLTTQYTYDTAGRVLTTTDGAGNVWSKTYDLMGHVLSRTDPLGNITSFAYDALGRLINTTDPKGGITTYTYNVHDKLVSSTDPLGNVTQFAYDGENRLISTTDALGRVSTITRDAKGQVTAVTDALGNITGNAYDAAGNRIQATDPLNKTTTFAYDNLQRQTTVTDPLAGATTKAYDVIGRVTQKTDATGHTTSFGYDAIGHLVSATDALAGNAAQGFDTDGNRTSFTDANGNTTSFTLDAAGRITSLTTADGGTTSYTYNTQNLVATAKNARNQTVTYTYDLAGRMTSMTDPVGTITFTYDANGNVLTVADAVGTVTYGYDAANRMTSYTDVYGNVIGYGYDAVDNLTMLTYPGNKVVTYAYDAGNRMTSVTDWAARTTTYTYDARGNVTAIARANGTSAAYVYDAKGQVTSLTEKLGTGANMYAVTYTYNAHGDITSETMTPAAAAPARATHTMTYGPDNRLATFDANPVAYDADGNMTTGPLNGAMTTFTYDARSRLTGTGTSSYVYDANGNRVSATHGAVTTRYVVDPNAPLSQVLMETDNAGTPIAYYVYGVGLISREDAAGTYNTYHYDSRGSTLNLTDAAGAVTDAYQYGPFGELLSATGATPNPFKYNGRDGVMTEANGLYYMRARYYTPDAKRFINRDVLLGNIQQALTLNRFAYVNGNPVGFVDPSGNFFATAAKVAAVYVTYSAVQALRQWATRRIQGTSGPNLLQSFIDNLVGTGNATEPITGNQVGRGLQSIPFTGDPNIDAALNGNDFAHNRSPSLVEKLRNLINGKIKTESNRLNGPLPTGDICQPPHRQATFGTRG